MAAFKYQISRIADWGMFYTVEPIPDYGSLAKPICLGKDINMELQIANIAGWGATTQGEPPNQYILSSVLLSCLLNIVELYDDL
jgi:hypothetical protein